MRSLTTFHLQIFLFLICVLLGLNSILLAVESGSSARISCQTDQSSAQLSFKADQFQTEIIQTDEGFKSLILIDNEPVIEENGFPVIPFISRSILIPLEGNVYLETTNVSYRTFDNLQLVQADLSDYSENLKTNHTKFSGSKFENYFSADEDGFWPPEPVTIGDVAILRGYRIINFRIHPVQYNITTGETRFNEEIEFHFSFDSDIPAVESYSNLAYPSLNAWRALNNLVENPPPIPSRDDLLSSEYLYIVPQVNNVDETLQPLIEWRKRQGHRVRVEHVQNGNNNRANVHEIIREAYADDPPVEFVALVGDGGGSDISIQAATNAGDYQYTLLEGNDELPDIALGRISCENIGELERIVDKLVSYESTPYMDETEWYLQGAVVAGHRQNGLGTVLVAKYVRRELYKIGFTEVRSWLHTEDGEISGNQPFVSNVFDWGISCFSYRAYQYMNRLPTNVIDNLANRRGRWPAVLAISCNTGDFVGNADGHTEHFLRARGGGIGAIGTATAGTAPQYNNMMAGGTWKGIYKSKLYAFGWGMNNGKYELWQAYNGFDNRYQGFMDWNNLMGDPGTHIWTGIPALINVEHPEMVPIGGSSVIVNVTNAEGVELSDALVCLYQEDEVHLTRFTDNNGQAVFAIDPESLTEGQCMITVTKHNIHPYLGEIAIQSPQFFLGIEEFRIDDDENGNSSGNNNGIINPNETIELELTITNIGEETPVGILTMHLESLSPFIEVPQNDIEVVRSPNPGESVAITFLLDVDSSCPDSDDHLLQLLINNNESMWESAVSIPVEAPLISVADQNLNQGRLSPGEATNFNPTLSNDGRFGMAPSSVILTCENEVVSILRNEAEYDSIEAQGQLRAEGNGFRVQPNILTIPGMQVEFMLVVNSESEFSDTCYTTVTIGRPERSDPFGPDDYGYICFDSNDEDWEMAPEYNWIEINPNIDGNDFDGTDLGIEDATDNQDASIAIALPFDFQYYGEVFDTLTICSNGWAAFGDQEEFAAFRNRRIGQALGPDAMLCAWWDNLVLRDNSAILSHYDAENGKFIIEWSQMRRLISGGVGAEETFEIILYDPDVHPSYTGDGAITFQYKEVTNENRQARNDTPFCTIGIGNLDDSGGLEYTYWNTNAPGASPIQNEMAITFTTALTIITGTLEGTVYNAATEAGIPDAIVSSRGFSALTDENGFYTLDILIGEDLSLTASAEGYLDSTKFGFDIVENDTQTVDFGLLFSSFSLSHDRIDQALGLNESIDIEIGINNEGNGPLRWSSERSYGEGESGFGSRIRSLLVGPEVNDLGLEAVAFAEDNFYVAGQNGQDPNMIYVFDSEGEHIDQFEQRGNSRVGFEDMTYGEGLLWGSGERNILGFDLEGRLVESFSGPFINNKALAIDSDHDRMWVTTRNQAIVGVNLEGDRIENIATDLTNITGMAYWADDPDGFNLWVLDDPGQNRSIVYKI
nr:carboxypeptidase regulatory-like domain-containing protein [bacterium]